MVICITDVKFQDMKIWPLSASSIPGTIYAFQWGKDAVDATSDASNMIEIWLFH